MMKRIWGLLCLIGLTTYANAQEVKDVKLDWYGFVRNEFFIDSYKGLDAANETFYLVPLYVGKDANGEDINEQASSNLSALASRIGLRISGPEILGAKSSGNIEFDFGGIVKTEPTLFRIRHANMVLDWESSRLLVGQTWHPFWGGGAFPTVAGLNTGAPFQAFNRSPMVRYDMISGNWTVSGAAVYENQYTSKCFEASNFSTPNQAQRNGVMPELVWSTEYHHNGFTAGVGAQIKRIKPRMTVTGTEGKFKADEFLTSSGFMAYFKHKQDKLSVVAKGYCGQNMTHLTFLGGYGVATRDEATGEETYTNYNNYTTLLNVVYGKKWQVGALFGYGGNLGTTDPLYDDGSGKGIVTGLLPNVQNLARVSPHVALNVSKLRVVAEYELTIANYGVGAFDFSDGLYADKHQTMNNRFCVMMMYLF
ncbi:hypothetical protein [Sunxiuqinia elliptica]|uniref:Outer membrane protein n=2 Tax=Sunxiuqinia elliptica TaxID=655355 RepID=A0A4R6GM96_9BACT|nr:hypothetical protein [Sunxiuqinia elliptica]TDN96329.1 hypothetical protein DET52_112156 [Sunxiuqinia elliptica]TDO68040.1 hypothetical protein DET65_0156 [Sunxiuqinia elliptica]